MLYYNLNEGLIYLRLADGSVIDDFRVKVPRLKTDILIYEAILL